MFKRANIRLLLCIALLFSMSFCDKEEDEPTPDIPSHVTLIMDFSNFPDDTKQWNNRGLEESTHFQHAVSSASWWNSKITNELLIPIDGFVEAFNHDGVNGESNTWQWSYPFKSKEENYSAKLIANVEDMGLVWKLLITKSPDYTDFEWLTGTSNFAGSQGTWKLKHEPQHSVDFLTVDWQLDPNTKAHQIKYVYVFDDEDKDSFIQNGLSSDGVHDSYFDILRTKNDSETKILWNKASKAGRVQDASWFVDSDWRCWNETLEDITCQ